MTTDGSDPTPTPATARPRSAGPARVVLLGLFSVVLVVALVLAVVGFTSRSDPGFGIEGQSEKVQREREDVMAQAEQFMLRINTYGPDLLEGTTMPKYRDLVTKVITAKFGTDFEKNVPAAEATVADAGLARTTTVLNTAVSTLDSDSATALVAGSYTNSFPKTEGSTERVSSPPSPYRVEVDLVKVDGTWLVDNFDPVTGLEDDQASQSPTDAPSTVPTTVPTTDPSTGATP